MLVSNFAYLHYTKEQNIAMESKLNLKAIEAYAGTYAAKLCERLFAGKDKITGADILSLPVKQTGLFVLNTIYQSWGREAEKLKSPYFDYEAGPVKAGLQKLMNVLSQHILLDRPHFEPLLAGAVQDTLLLLLSPYSYYKDLLMMEGVSVAQLQGMRKFVKINQGVLAGILAKLGEEPDMLHDTDKLLDAVFATLQEAPQPIEETLSLFAALVPVTADGFYAEEKETPPLVPGFGDEDEEEEANDTATLNARFGESSYETVADKLKSNQPADSLKSMLSINQKFMFINDLFDGSQEDFFKVLDFLEACDSKEAAVSFVQNNYLKHNIWKANAPQVKEFMALLDKKFAR